MALRFCILLAGLLAGACLLLAQPAPTPVQAAGDATSAGLISRSLTLARAPLRATAVTTTTLKAIPSPSVLTETVWLEATVTGSLAGLTPTGTVCLSTDGTLFGCDTLYTDNWVRLELPALGTGTHILTASYSGDSTFAPSNAAPLSHIVRRSGVRLGLGYAQGLQVAFTFEVVPESGAPPDGSVTVSDGTSSCTATASAGSCTITFPSAGPRRLTATYSGSATLESNVSAPLDYTVERYFVDIRTQVTPQWVDAGQPVTVTFVIMPYSVLPYWPTGTVTVRVDSGSVCSVPQTTGSCTFTPVGRFPIYIDYSGDDYFAPKSVSLLPPVRVATGIHIDGTPNPVRASQVLTLTAGLTSNGNVCDVTYLCAPTGQVYYYDNGTYLATAGVHPRVGAVLPITVTLTRIDMHTITGSYSGNTFYSPSTSAPLTVEVVPQTQYLPLIAAP